MKKLILLCLTSALFYACDYNLTAPPENENNSLNSEVTISHFNLEEEANDETIINAAETLSAELFGKSRAIDNSSAVIEPIVRDGKTLMHVINFSNNNGFIILSALRTYKPLLAYNTVGNFDCSDQNNQGLLEWLDTQSKDISVSNELPDSIKLANLAEWNRLSPSLEIVPNPAQTRSASSFEQQKYTAISQWRSEGFDVYPLSDIINADIHTQLPISHETLNQFMAYSFLFDNYSSLSNRQVIDDSFVLIKKRRETVDNFGKMTITAWNQNAPYNKAIPVTPINDSTRRLLGCTAVALGQIVAYKGTLPGYNFAHIQNANAGSPWMDECADFLYYIGRNIGIDYYHGSSDANDEMIINGIKNLGYSYKKSNYDPILIRGSLRKDIPVMVIGYKKNKVGHAWIVEGSELFINHDVCKLALVIENAEDISDNGYWYPSSNDMTTQDSRLYFNWGWGGLNDGFYNDYFCRPDADYYDYNINRYIITDIKRK